MEVTTAQQQQQQQQQQEQQEQQEMIGTTKRKAQSMYQQLMETVDLDAAIQKNKQRKATEHRRERDGSIDFSLDIILPIKDDEKEITPQEMLQEWETSKQKCIQRGRRRAAMVEKQSHWTDDAMVGWFCLEFALDNGDNGETEEQQPECKILLTDGQDAIACREEVDTVAHCEEVNRLVHEYDHMWDSVLI